MEFFKKNSPLVSIIIVNLNGKEDLKKCLASILKLNYTNYEIIVVDNNSTDGSIEFMEKNYPQIIIKKLEKNYGFAYPNNIGVELSQGQFLFFLNNDTIITENTISELIDVFQNNNEIGICQSLLLHPSGEIDSSGDFLHISGLPYSSKKLVNHNRKIFSARGAALMIRSKLFTQLGGFNKFFFAAFEDVDLCWRSWIYGSQVFLVPKSIVYHKGSETIKKIEKNIQVHSFKNFLLLNFFNLETKKIFSFMFSLPRIFFIKSKSNNLKNMQSPTITYILSGFVWILKNIKYIQITRKTINSKRIVSTNQLIDMKLISKDFK